MSSSPEPTADELLRKVERLERRAARERSARKQAEELLESKSAELYEAHKDLSRSNADLERRVDERTEQLLDALDRAESSSRAKSEFLASMSHEIRTPLHAVLASLELLDATDLEPEQMESVGVAERAARALLGLIDDLLDLAKVESGRLELVDEPFDPAALVREAGELFEARARAKGLELTVEVDVETGTVNADRPRLRQVLLNLLSNAIKFTLDGRVTIRLEETAPGSFRFEVSDTGAGIAPEDQPKVFEQYSQVAGANSGGVKGTGLGLAISAQIVRLMGAEIELESEVGRGTSFSFQVQLERAESSVESDSDEDAAEQASLEGVRVLAVDDNAVNLRVIERMLNLEGVDALTASGGIEALQILAFEDVDLVLLDQQMPDLDGSLVTEAIREGEYSVLDPRVIIVALTANAMRGERERCIELGMDGFLSKPLSRAQLREELLHWKARDFQRLRRVV